MLIVGCVSHVLEEVVIDTLVVRAVGVGGGVSCYYLTQITTGASNSLWVG